MHAKAKNRRNSPFWAISHICCANSPKLGISEKICRRPTFRFPQFWGVPKVAKNGSFLDHFWSKFWASLFLVHAKSGPGLLKAFWSFFRAAVVCRAGARGGPRPRGSSRGSPLEPIPSSILDPKWAQNRPFQPPRRFQAVLGPYLTLRGRGEFPPPP